MLTVGRKGVSSTIHSCEDIFLWEMSLSTKQKNGTYVDVISYGRFLPQWKCHFQLQHEVSKQTFIRKTHSQVNPCDLSTHRGYGRRSTHFRPTVVRCAGVGNNLSYKQYNLVVATRVSLRTNAQLSHISVRM